MGRSLNGLFTTPLYIGTYNQVIGMVAFIGGDVLAGVDWRVDRKKEFDNVVFGVIIVEAFFGAASVMVAFVGVE